MVNQDSGNSPTLVGNKNTHLVGNKNTYDLDGGPDRYNQEGVNRYNQEGVTSPVIGAEGANTYTSEESSSPRNQTYTNTDQEIGSPLSAVSSAESDDSRPVLRRLKPTKYELSECESLVQKISAGEYTCSSRNWDGVLMCVFLCVYFFINVYFHVYCTYTHTKIYTYFIWW
jgi:hypothetical protein